MFLKVPQCVILMQRPDDEHIESNLHALWYNRMSRGWRSWRKVTIKDEQQHWIISRRQQQHQRCCDFCDQIAPTLHRCQNLHVNRESSTLTWYTSQRAPWFPSVRISQRASPNRISISNVYRLSIHIKCVPTETNWKQRYHNTKKARARISQLLGLLAHNWNKRVQHCLLKSFTGGRLEVRMFKLHVFLIGRFGYIQVSQLQTRFLMTINNFGVGRRQLRCWSALSPGCFYLNGSPKWEWQMCRDTSEKQEIESKIKRIFGTTQRSSLC
jgi:hypothetical protein